MSKPRITIKDIAKELKISTSTVSRALTDKWDVNPETRKAVLELAEKFNYKPNPISQNLKRKESRFVGVVVPEFINSFFSEVIIGIQSVLEPEGYLVLVTQSNESYENERKNIKALEERMVDGLIVSVTQETQNADCFNYLVENNIPLVFFNRICPTISTSHVIIDDYKWAYKAVEHLIKQGYKRIAHLMGPENLLVSKKRKEGYLTALKDYSLEINEELIIPCGLMMESGVVAAYKILEMPALPDAIFAVNDPVAIGAMKTLQKHGKRIPEDVAIVGFSESKMAMIIEPNLTSVEQPTFEMGRMAAELLLEQVNSNKDDKCYAKSIILDGQLNIRESSISKQLTSK